MIIAKTQSPEYKKKVFLNFFSIIILNGRRMEERKKNIIIMKLLMNKNY